jgi:diamine N-acetyltransferase
VETTIRKATPQDYDELCIVIDEGDALHRDNVPQRFQKPTGPVRDRDYILGLLADENVGLFVAEQEGKLVGFVHVIIRDAPPLPILVPRRYAIIDSIAVRKEYRGQGIGHALMAQAHDWATAKGATTVELNVYDFNKQAIAFYRSLGYEIQAHWMRKPLENL